MKRKVEEPKTFLQAANKALLAKEVNKRVEEVKPKASKK